MTLLGTLTNAASGFGTQAPAATGGVAGPATGGNVGITVSPTAVNLGEILKPFMGSPQNGGAGLTYRSRLGYASGDITGFTADQPKSNLIIIGGVALAAVVGIYYITK